MPLNDRQLRALSPVQKSYKKADGLGLYIEVTPGGSKLWRFKYRFGDKEKRLSLGRYPEVSLAEARHKRDDLRALIRSDLDPSRERQRKKAEARVGSDNSFTKLAEEYIQKMVDEGLAEGTLQKARWFLSLLKPTIGHIPVGDVEPRELLGALKIQEKKDNRETAKKCRSFASRVFRYAVQTGRASSDPAELLKGALLSPKVKHYAAILDPEELSALLKAIDDYSGYPSTRLALQIAPHVFLRPGELRQADWSEIDLQKCTWEIPAQRMKAEVANERRQAALNTFSSIAEEFISKSEKEGRAAVTIKKTRWLLSLLEPDLGARPISEITPAELLTTLQKIETKGHLETARRMRSFSGRVFRYAVATSRGDSDPSALLKGALVAPTVTHHSAILEPAKVGELLRAIDGFSGQPLTHLALQLTPHVFVRPGELRRAEWTEVDFEKATWTIPAEKMKMRDPHVVPLSRQSLELLEAAHALSSDQRFVFSSLYPGNRPMSENTINAALRRLGYSGKEMTAHGFRSMASTLLNESGKWSADAIERALAHKDANTVRAAYNRGAHWEERVAMAQWWSDYLDKLKVGGEVVPLQQSLGAVAR